jgi:PmbA protein
VEWIRGEDFLGVYDGEETKTQLQWERVVGQILKRLDWAKYNAPSPLGKVPVLFTGNAATMLWNTVSSALSAKRVLERSSPWNESIGELVVSELLNLSQQPDKEPYNCPFDDEGTPTQYINLIDRGRLIQFYGDRTTGRILGTGTTGNGFRPSLGHYPSPGLVNLAIAPGNLSFTEAIATLEEGIIVDQMLGGGADISGDFSVNIDLGYLVKRGEIVGRVKDTMIAGNVYHALKEVIALLSDTQWNGSYYTPSLIVDGLSVIS